MEAAIYVIFGYSLNNGCTGFVSQCIPFKLTWHLYQSFGNIFKGSFTGYTFVPTLVCMYVHVCTCHIWFMLIQQVINHFFYKIYNTSLFLLLLSVVQFHSPQSITQIVHIFYSHTFVDRPSVKRSTPSSYKPSHSTIITYMSFVDSLVLPMQRACCFPSAIIACSKQTDNISQNCSMLAWCIYCFYQYKIYQL